jgi:glycosyltransferase involved in cell wall biosynthesis
VEKTICYLSRYEAMQGHQVTVFNLTDKPVLEIGDGVRVENFKPIFKGWLIPAELKRAIAGLNPDVIHLHSVYVPSNAAVARFARSIDIPYITTPNGNLSPLLLKRRPWLKQPYKLLFELPMQNKATFVHAINDFDDIRSYGVKSPIVSAPNGMEIDDGPMPADYFSEKFPKFSHLKRILFLGRLDVEQKGLDLLIESYAKLDDSQSVLILAGTSWKNGLERLEGLAEKLNIRQRIVFYGGVFGEEKRSLLRHSDYFIHTSRWEAGIPFSVLEGLAAGLPTMVTPGADPKGLVSQSNAGINVKSDVDSITVGLRELLSLDSETLKNSSIAARNLVHSTFSWEQIAKTIVTACSTHRPRH